MDRRTEQAPPLQVFIILRIKEEAESNVRERKKVLQEKLHRRERMPTEQGKKGYIRIRDL